MWNWQEAMAIKYKRDEILEDILKDSSLLLEMAKEDVAKILQKTPYSFVVQKLEFDDIYNISACVLKKQLEKIQQKKKGFLICSETCSFDNVLIIKKIIQRIANNIKNLFDERYKACIKEDLKYKYHDHGDNGSTCDDALAIILIEEEQVEMEEKRTKNQSEYIEYIKEIIKIDSSGQTLLSFN